MDKKLNTYLIEFCVEDEIYKFGVTAWSFDDAMSIIEEKGFPKDKMPDFGIGSEDVTLSDLDKDYVRPFVGDMKKRGIWFVSGF